MDIELKLLTERINDLENEIIRLRSELNLEKQPKKPQKSTLVNSLLSGTFKGVMLLVSSRGTIQQQLLNYQSWYNNNPYIAQLVLATIPNVSRVNSPKSNSEQSEKK